MSANSSQIIDFGFNNTSDKKLNFQPHFTNYEVSDVDSLPINQKINRMHQIFDLQNEELILNKEKERKQRIIESKKFFRDQALKLRTGEVHHKIAFKGQCARGELLDTYEYIHENDKTKLRDFEYLHTMNKDKIQERTLSEQVKQPAWNYVSYVSKPLDPNHLTDKDPQKTQKQQLPKTQQQQNSQYTKNKLWYNTTHPNEFLSQNKVDYCYSYEMQFEPKYYQNKPFKPVTKHNAYFDKKINSGKY